ncbi:NMDA receptor synaptonuclear signaling and neuronal migration factor-like [Clytia hemisphaerica]|uniref:Uncharacterized protein n=1 Tax=Clytia hemisphaerica TaxID=252671 RepID=A0A7M5UNN4_9CNID
MGSTFTKKNPQVKPSLKSKTQAVAAFQSKIQRVDNQEKSSSEEKQPNKWKRVNEVQSHNTDSTDNDDRRNSTPRLMMKETFGLADESDNHNGDNTDKSDDNDPTTDDKTTDEEAVKQRSARIIQRSFRKHSSLTNQHPIFVSPKKENNRSFNDNESSNENSYEQSFENFQLEIEETKWLAEKQIETALMNNGEFEPKTLVMVSSNVCEPEKLKNISQKNVDVVVFDFAKSTLNDLLNSIALYLDEPVEGTKLKSIAFVLQGGPGYFYLCKQTAVTIPKITKNVELRVFFESLGDMLSKLDPDSCTIDFIVRDVTREHSDYNLIRSIRKLLVPNKVSVRTIPDISSASLEIVEKYFDNNAYKLWTQQKYIKTRK